MLGTESRDLDYHVIITSAVTATNPYESTMTRDLTKGVEVTLECAINEILKDVDVSPGSSRHITMQPGIFQAIKQGIKDANYLRVPINLTSGKYALINHEGNLLLIAAGGIDFKIASFGPVTLERFKEKCGEMVLENSSEQVSDIEFVVVEPGVITSNQSNNYGSEKSQQVPKKEELATADLSDVDETDQDELKEKSPTYSTTSNQDEKAVAKISQLNDDELSGEHLDEFGFNLVSQTAVTCSIESTFPPYLQHSNVPMGDSGLKTELRQYIDPKPSKGDMPDLQTMANRFGNLALYPLVTGQTEALNFIDLHKNDRELVIVPYVAAKRIVGEDHVVLLVMKGGQSAMIDPKKIGLALGMKVWWATNHTHAIGWQDLSDKINCGFYAYHMITKMIEAFKTGNLQSIDSVDTLVEFIKGLPKPLPADIRTQMRDIRIGADKKRQSGTVDQTNISTANSTSNDDDSEDIQI